MSKELKKLTKKKTAAVDSSKKAIFTNRAIVMENEVDAKILFVDRHLTVFSFRGKTFHDDVYSLVFDGESFPDDDNLGYKTVAKARRNNSIALWTPLTIIGGILAVSAIFSWWWALTILIVLLILIAGAEPISESLPPIFKPHQKPVSDHTQIIQDILIDVLKDSKNVDAITFAIHRKKTYLSGGTEDDTFLQWVKILCDILLLDPNFDPTIVPLVNEDAEKVWEKLRGEKAKKNKDEAVIANHRNEIEKEQLKEESARMMEIAMNEIEFENRL